MKWIERYWWLRLAAIGFHASLFFRVRIVPIKMQILASRSKLSRNEAFSGIATELLALAAELERRPLPEKAAYMFSYRLWLRFVHYGTITGLLIVLPEEIRGRLPPDLAKQVVHCCHLAVALYEDGAKDYIAERAKRRKTVSPVVSGARTLSSVYRLLASTYLRLQPSDAAFDSATAFEYLASAAKCLEGLDHPEARWDAAGIMYELGESLLAHPYEVDSVPRAETALQHARQLIESDFANLTPPPEIVWENEQWSQLPLSVRVRQSMSYAVIMSRSRRQMRSGHADPLHAWFRLAPLMPRINCQLAVIYRRQGNASSALECLTAALTHQEHDRDVVAHVNCEIGYTYLECDSGPRKKEHLDIAIVHFDKTIDLQKKTRFISPLLRAMIGAAYAVVGLTEIAVDSDRTRMIPRLDRMARNLRIAMTEARNRDMIDLCQEAAFVLGLVQMNKRNYACAYKAFSLSSRLVDRLRKSYRTPRLKWYRIGPSSLLYNNLLFAALRYKHTNTGDLTVRTGAATYARLGSLFTFSERGRAVFLQEAMANRSIVPRGAQEEDMREFFALRRAWHQAEIDLQTRQQALTDENAVASLRNKRDGLERRYFTSLQELRELYSDQHYDPDMPVAPSHFCEIRNAVNRLAQVKTIALVQYHVSQSRIHVMVLLPKCPRSGNYIYSKEIVLDCDDVWDVIRGWGVQQINGAATISPGGGDAKNWVHWGRSILVQTLERLRELAEYPSGVITQWELRTGSKVECILIAPHKFLHLVPLHAIRLASGSAWADSVAIQYVPSASVLCRLVQASDQTSAQPRSDRSTAVSIAGPSDDHFFEQEARTVSQMLGGSYVSGRDKSIRDVIQEIKDAHYIHFSCHGVYDPFSPMSSGLDCARVGEISNEHGEPGRGPIYRSRLTLGDIFERVHLAHAPIVVLSACDSGISKIEQSRDEYIGLPAGFLYAGARAVVSSLWPVADPAVHLLMTQMARRLADGTNISEALRNAQQWVRTLSRDEAIREAGAILQGNGRLQEPDDAELIHQEFPMFRIFEAHPFENPYWWAGFTINGLA